MTLVPVRDAARGKWRGVLSTLGIEGRFLSGKNGPCPVCGKGKDCFRFTDKNQDGVWLCSKCSDAGDGLSLLMKVNGWDFKHAAETVEGVIGSVRPETRRPERSSGDKRRAMASLWKSSKPVATGDPVDLWLKSRVGISTVPTCLRYAAKARYQAETAQYLPAMLALVRDASGEPVNIHRTYLTLTGAKAAVEKPRQVMQGILPAGSAIRLFPPDTRMGIAEGIETAFAAASLFGVPTWSAINADILSKWTPPNGVSEVLIFGDHDPKLGGHKAAWTLAHRLAVLGIANQVRIPERQGFDWNTVLLQPSEAAA